MVRKSVFTTGEHMRTKNIVFVQEGIHLYKFVAIMLIEVTSILLGSFKIMVTMILEEKIQEALLHEKALFHKEAVFHEEALSRE